MANRDYDGLSAEFASPTDAAEKCARLATIEERLAFVERIPRGGWRWWILFEAQFEIAYAIAKLPDLDDRRRALALVPEPWLEEVRAHVLRLWNTREIRAEYQRELAGRRRPAQQELAAA